MINQIEAGAPIPSVRTYAPLRAALGLDEIPADIYETGRDTVGPCIRNRPKAADPKRFTRRHHCQGVAEACREVECSRASLYRWLAAYEAHGIEGLREGSHRPLRSVRVPAWVEHVVSTIRVPTYWNSKRIAAEKERRQTYRVGHDYIDRLLASKGCARGSVMRERGPRYGRTRPNEWSALGSVENPMVGISVTA